MRESVEQVACRLGISTDGEHIGLETSHLLNAHLGLVGAVEVITHAHNQVVLVAVKQQRVGDAIKELIVEPGHTDDTQVKQRQRVGHATAAFGPLVTPCSTGNDTGVFGTRLIVEVDGKSR